MSKMNAVVVGCGAIGPIHMNAVHATEYAALYGVCDIENERADRYAKEFGCKAFYSIEDVLRDYAVDSRGLGGKKSGSGKTRLHESERIT